jgi:hemoglobin-like flavoprotein
MHEPTGGEAMEAAVGLARHSYERCSTVPGFFRAFYDDFLARCPEAKPRFAKTDFERQNNLLRHAIGLLLIFPSQSPTELNLLTRVAARHSRRDLDIPPALYSPFIESLIATTRRYDAEFSPAVEQAWRAALAPGVAYMQARY